MRRAAALSGLRSCVCATSVDSIVQAKVLSHFLRSESATLAFAQALHYICRKIVILNLIDVVEDHLANVESFSAPSLFSHTIETTLDVFGKADGRWHKGLSRILVSYVFIVSRMLCPQ